MGRSSRYFLLIALTAIAAWLRFSAIGFGLPEQYRPDEEMTVPTALGFEHDFNPHLAIYPAAQTYLIHGVLRSYAALSGAGSNWRMMYRAEGDARAFRIARKIAAAMGTATVPAVYLAAASSFGPQAAIAAAGIVAVAFIHVRDSKFAKVEVPAGFWLALSLAMMLLLAKRGRLIDYGLAGLFCGLAAATHYTSGSVAIGIVVAHLEARQREAKPLLTSLLDARIYLAGAITLLAFLSADPYFVLDWAQTTADFGFMRVIYADWNHGHSAAGYGWTWLLLRAMPASFGIALEIFLLVAMVWVVFRPRPGTYALLAFVAVCFLSLTRGHPQLEFRYLVNPLIAMALLGGVMAEDLIAMAQSWMPRMRYVAALVGVLLLAPSLLRDIQLNHLLRAPDTRTIAKFWILNHIPSRDSIVLVDGYDYGKPRIAGGYNLIDAKAESATSLRDAIKSARWVIAESFPPLTQWSRDVNAEEKAELDSRGELQLDVPSIKPDAALPVCDPNDAFYVPFTHIDSMIRPGPRIRIWKITRDSIPGTKLGGSPG